MTEATAYLDYNATAPVRPEVGDAMRATLGNVGNPSSVHGAGRAARAAVEEARERVAALAGAAPETVIFTSGGTEANNLALKGVGVRRLMVSSIEHGSVLAAALMADADAVMLPVDGEGVLDPSAFEAALDAEEGPKLVSVMLANNETGVIEPVARIAEIAHGGDTLVHCDAVQAAGKIPLDFQDLGIDLMSLSAHKIGGSQGVGALVVRDDIRLAAQIIGGGQERGRRSGTENVPGIIGFGVAAELAAQNLADSGRLAAMRDEMERRLVAVTGTIERFGARVDRLPNTSCLTMPGVASETQVMALDLAGIEVSAGAACSSGKVARSHVLEAMGVPDERAECAIRVSLGWDTREGDIDRLVAAWTEIYHRVAQAA